MSPVWEANHVWLIFVLVILWTAFPVVFGSVFSTLSIPLFLAAIGIIFRGTAFALRGQAATINEARVLGAVFALSSVLIPFFLGAAIGGVASGRVPVGNAAGRSRDLVAEPDVGADRRRRRAQRRVPGRGVPGGRLRARGAAGPRARVPRAGARDGGRDRRGGARGAARAALRRARPVRRADQRRRARDGARLGRGRARRRSRSSYRERYGLARFTAAGAVAAIVVGWVLAQSPYVLPGRAHARGGGGEQRDAVGGRDRRRAPGMVILVPSLWWLYRLVLQGRLDQEYEPLDQRFHP